MKRNEAIKQAIKAISIVINGGKGSGNFGHAGRPGKVGGSGEGGASDSSTSSPSSKDLMPKRGSYSDLPTIKRTYTDSVTGAQREEVLYRPVFDEKAAKAGSSTPYMYVSENGQKLEGFSKKDYEAILNSDHTKELTDEQKKAITDYTSEYGEGSYKNVNKYARTGQGSDAVKKAYKDVISAVDRPLGNNAILFRGVGEEVFTDKDMQTFAKQAAKGNFSKLDKFSEKIGKYIYQDKAPTSTTIRSGELQEKGTSGYGQNNVGLHILADKNTKGMYVSKLSKYGGKAMDLKGMGTNTNFESEVLLHPDNRFKVAAVAFQSLGTTGSSGSKKTKVRTDVYMVPINHKYVSVKTNTQGLKTYTYRRPDSSTYTIQTA
jgi:hypothetical protein